MTRDHLKRDVSPAAAPHIEPPGVGDVPVPVAHRRACPRIPCSQAAVILPLGPFRGATSFAGARCRDLSPAGMRLVTELTLRPGDPVRVKLKAPPRIVEFEGQIVWTDAASQAGVRFTSVADDGAHHLANYLVELASHATAANDGAYDAA